MLLNKFKLTCASGAAVETCRHCARVRFLSSHNHTDGEGAQQKKISPTCEVLSHKVIVQCAGRSGLLRCIHELAVLQGGGLGRDHRLHDAVEDTGCVIVQHGIKAQAWRTWGAVRKCDALRLKLEKHNRDTTSSVSDVDD